MQISPIDLEGSLPKDRDFIIVTKELLLRQKGSYLSKKCLKFIAWYSHSLFLSAFEALDTFSCFFLAIEWTKPKKSSKILVNFFANFMTILYQKVKKKILLIIQKASISNSRSQAIKCSCHKKLVWKSFLDTILQSRSLCLWRIEFIGINAQIS